MVGMVGLEVVLMITHPDCIGEDTVVESLVYVVVADTFQVVTTLTPYPLTTPTCPSPATASRPWSTSILPSPWQQRPLFTVLYFSAKAA